MHTFLHRFCNMHAWWSSKLGSLPASRRGHAVSNASTRTLPMATPPSGLRIAATWTPSSSWQLHANLKLAWQSSTDGQIGLHALRNGLNGGFSTWSDDNKHLGAPTNSRELAVGILRRGALCMLFARCGHSRWRRPYLDDR